MGSFRGCTNCLLVLKAPVLQEGSVWGQEGEWVEDRPSGNPASVFLGRRPRGGTPPPPPPSAPYLQGQGQLLSEAGFFCSKVLQVPLQGSPLPAGLLPEQLTLHLCLGPQEA